MANNSLEQLSLHTIGGGWGAEIADVTNDIRVSVIRGTDIPRLRVGDFSSVPVRYESAAKIKSRLLKPGDIVIEASGGSTASGQHTGRALLITQQMVESLGGNVIPASFCRLLRLDSRRVNSRFIVYQIDALHLSGEISEFENQSTGIANFQFTRFIQETYPCIEDLQTQSAIAHILGTLDDKIELNRRQNETLEAMARALFRAWFVDFEPVRAKREGRWRRGESLPGLPAHLYDLFPERLVESELGEIPEGWECVAASKIIEFNPPESLRKGADAPYIEMAALPVSGSWPEPPIFRPFGSGMRFRNGDTLLARITPCLENGKTAFIQCLQDNTVGWGSTEYIVMRPKPPVPPEFGYLLARDAAFREQAIRSMTGTSGRQRVQADSVAAFKLAAPTLEAVWDAFSCIVASSFKAIKANAEAITTLAHLRDTLLPKLISGELRVPDAEAFFRERKP